jgi:hypothetical protein
MAWSDGLFRIGLDLQILLKSRRSDAATRAVWAPTTNQHHCQRSLATPDCARPKWRARGVVSRDAKLAGMCDGHRPLLFKIRSITSAPVVITGHSSCR